MQSTLIHNKEKADREYFKETATLLRSGDSYSPCLLRDGPFNFKEGGGYGFFSKKYSDSQCC